MSTSNTNQILLPVFSAAPNPAAFWLVWSPHGGVPTVKHETEASATAEAHRLCLKHRERKFYVLRSVSEWEQIVTQTTITETRHAQ